jgi:hypothetical protein
MDALAEEVKGRGRALAYGTEINPGKMQEIKVALSAKIIF